MLKLIHDKHWAGGLPAWDMRSPESPYWVGVARSGLEPTVEVFATPEFMDTIIFPESGEPKSTGDLPSAISSVLFEAVLKTQKRALIESGLRGIREGDDPIPIFAAQEVNGEPIAYLLVITAGRENAAFTFMTLRQGMEGKVFCEDQLNDVMRQIRDMIDDLEDN